MKKKTKRKKWIYQKKKEEARQSTCRRIQKIHTQKHIITWKAYIWEYSCIVQCIPFSRRAVKRLNELQHLGVREKEKERTKNTATATAQNSVWIADWVSETVKAFKWVPQVHSKSVCLCVFVCERRDKNNNNSEEITTKIKKTSTKAFALFRIY